MAKVFPLILGLLFFLKLSCASKKELLNYFERSPLVGVVYGLKPAKAGNSMQIFYEKEGNIGQNFPDGFSQTAVSVKEAIAESWSLPNTYVVENRSQFKADLVAGVWLKGWYEQVQGFRYKFIAEGYVLFMDEHLRKYVGKAEGYLVAKSETMDFEVKEVKSYIDRGMKRQAFEQLLRFIPPEKILPDFSRKMKEGTIELMTKIRENSWQ